MTPEEKAKLDNLYELTRENNEILRSLLKRAKISNALKIFYWVLIIGASLGAFFFIQPLVNQLTGLTSDASVSGNEYMRLLEDLSR